MVFVIFLYCFNITILSKVELKTVARLILKLRINFTNTLLLTLINFRQTITNNKLNIPTIHLKTLLTPYPNKSIFNSLR